jgi:hypothetical protein
MLNFGAFQVQIMGQTATFDVVTVYGLICAAVFLSGFIIATRFEKKRQSELD